MTIAPISVSTVLFCISSRLFRLPGLIVAGRGGADATAHQTAVGAIGAPGAGQVGAVLGFPALGLERRRGRRLDKSVVQPAMPVRRDTRGLDRAVIEDPAALAVLGLVVAIAEIIGADGLARKPSGHQGAVGGRFPPGEDHREKRHPGTVLNRRDYRWPASSGQGIRRRRGLTAI